MVAFLEGCLALFYEKTTQLVYMKLKFINALVAIMLFGCQSLFAQTQSVDFTAVAMNVDGLPAKILFVSVNGDGPGSEGTKLISQKIAERGWDFVGCSEDFENDTELRSALTGSYNFGTYRKPGSWTSALTSKLDTDGLQFIWKNSHTTTNETFVEWTEKYGGLTDGANTCLKKGYRYYTLTLEGGIEVDMYILHMDAGTGDDENGIKHGQTVQKQWAQLVADIKASNNKRPIIVMGDTNCRYTRIESPKSNFIDVLNADPRFDVHDGWIDKCKGGVYPQQGSPALTVGDLGYVQGEIVDKIFYINNTDAEVQLTLNQWYADTQFVKADGTPLADHFPVVGHFTATKNPQTVDPDQPGTGGEGGETTDPEQPVDPDDVERTDKDLSENGYWQWTGEEAVANTPVYLYNVGFKGFVKNDGTIVNNPVSLWTISSLNSGNVTCGNAYFYMDSSWFASSTAGVGTSNSGSTRSFTTTVSSTTSGAYKFVSGGRYFNAESASKWTRAQTASANNDFYIVTEAQKAVYDQYMEDYAKALNLLRTAQMPNQIYNELTEWLSKSVSVSNADEFHATVSALYMDVTIGTAKYASLCLPFDAWMPSSVNALFGVLKNSETITLVKMQGKVLAKNTGAVLFSDVEEATTFRFWRTTSAPTTEQPNVLKGTNVRLEAGERNQTDNSYYVLANKSAGIGFYILDESKNVAIPANRAYLELPKNAAVKVSGLTFEASEEADRLEKTEDVVKVSEVYALDGAKRSAMQRGLNIVKMSDGKVRKVMVR